MQIAIPHIARLRVILILTPSLYVFSFFSFFFRFAVKQYWINDQEEEKNEYNTF